MPWRGMSYGKPYRSIEKNIASHGKQPFYSASPLFPYDLPPSTMFKALRISTVVLL
jgi:hypothetical protein